MWFSRHPKPQFAKGHLVLTSYIPDLEHGEIGVVLAVKRVKKPFHKYEYDVQILRGWREGHTVTFDESSLLYLHARSPQELLHARRDLAVAELPTVRVPRVRAGALD